MKSFKDFIKPFAVPQRSVKKNLSYFSLFLRDQEGKDQCSKKWQIEKSWQFHSEKDFVNWKQNEKYTSLNVKIKSNFYNITQNKQIYDTFEDAHISPNTSTRIYIFKGSFLTF